jgi:hypothetical protein
LKRRAAAAAAALGPLLWLCFVAFGPQPATPEKGRCDPERKPFWGYTFLQPELLSRSAAFAPYFLKWDDYFDRYYFNLDIQKTENVEEWRTRFCSHASPAEVESVVYDSDFSSLNTLYRATVDEDKKTPLPYSMAGNAFAEVIALNGCAEAVSYLMYAKKCEPFVLPKGEGWAWEPRDTADMYMLIREGIGRFKDTESHFIRLRYAYQMVRLAHYLRDWNYTVDLYNYLMPKVDRKRPSIIYYWTLGHLAGALQQLGKYPEAAYRFSIVFRHCASKRTQAYRSFRIRNDQDWAQTLKLCTTDAERSTLYLLRAGGSHTFAVADMEQIHTLDPANPQLDLLLISDVQELEKIYLRTWVTDQKQGKALGAIKREAAAKHLLDLQRFVRKVIREQQSPNPKLWRALDGYLELLAGDRYAAAKTWDRLAGELKRSDEYDQKLGRQIEAWRCLLEILNLDPKSDKADNLAFRIRSYAAFKANPYFEPFLQEWLSASYAANQHPGKAILTAYPPSALGYNPSLEVLDDLLALANSDDPILLERTMQMDTNPERIRAILLERKGAYLLARGQPEAALAVMQKIIPSEAAMLPKFSPFREKYGEKVHREVIDSLQLNRMEIAQALIDLEQRAKAADALKDPEAARYWLRIGVAYYNMSYFGYEWEATDHYRSGYNQLRLPQGPVFPLANSPNGNREHTDLSLALAYFERALNSSGRERETAAKAAFWAARCQQKQYFCDKDCRYRPGSTLIPSLPDAYFQYYALLRNRYADTKFYNGIVKECKWLAAYTR